MASLVPGDGRADLAQLLVAVPAGMGCGVAMGHLHTSTGCRASQRLLRFPTHLYILTDTKAGLSLSTLQQALNTQ